MIFQLPLFKNIYLIMDSNVCQIFYEKIREERLLEIISIDLNTNYHVKKFVREFLENFLRGARRKLIYGRPRTASF